MFLKDDIMLSISFSSILQAKCIYFFSFFLFDNSSWFKKEYLIKLRLVTL